MLMNIQRKSSYSTPISTIRKPNTKHLNQGKCHCVVSDIKQQVDIKMARTVYHYGEEIEIFVPSCMGNECRKIIHADKIRNYYTRALACGLIVEEDEEFGSVVEVPLKQEEQKAERLNIDAEQINLLSAEQQGQLLTILDKYQDRFTERTGLCTLVEHEIELKPDV